MGSVNRKNAAAFPFVFARKNRCLRYSPTLPRVRRMPSALAHLTEALFGDNNAEAVRVGFRIGSDSEPVLEVMVGADSRLVAPSLLREGRRKTDASP